MVYKDYNGKMTNQKDILVFLSELKVSVAEKNSCFLSVVVYLFELY
jgi:hypothetical protein